MQIQDEKKLEDVLVQLNLVKPEQLDLAKIESVRGGQDVNNVLVDMGFISFESMTKAKAVSLGIPYVDLSDFNIDPKILKYVPKNLAERFRAVPFSLVSGTLKVAMLDPNNVQAIEYIEKKSGLSVTPYLASETSVKNAIDQYQDITTEVGEALKNIELSPVIEIKESDKTTETLSQDAPVTRAVNTILEYAIKAKASDVHLEPREKSIKVRYRIDGVLHETMSLPVHILAAIISRIKILSNLKIDEHRVPQDGRFGLKINEKEVDVRVAVSPTVFGEKVVMRLLDKTSGLITLEDLGIKGRGYKLIEEGAKRPHGMILSTGPTGSGKSTTLYALLNKMNSTEVNIITLEDPVEYQVDGINQIQVNSAVGLTFASGLRSILRQDPDIIMVGEIRDAETAGLAIQSALTGHTVLSTLHTNNAAGVLPRLLDMDIEPFLIASTVNTVIGQRLVRRICPNCKESYEASIALVKAIKDAVGEYFPMHGIAKKNDKYSYTNLPYQNEEKLTLYKGKGCEECHNTGYQGRIGIYEVFPVTPVMEKLLLTNSTSSEIQDAAVKEGMITMRQDGFLKALEGITTVEEVVSRITEY